MAPRRFTDIDMDFKRHPISSDLVRVRDEDAIKQALRNLIYTKFYDVPFEPTKGNKIGGILFEPVSGASVHQLQYELRNLIDKYEPRVEVLNLKISISDDDTSYHVRLRYKIINTINPVELTFMLERIR